MVRARSWVSSSMAIADFSLPALRNSCASTFSTVRLVLSPCARSDARARAKAIEVSWVSSSALTSLTSGSTSTGKLPARRLLSPDRTALTPLRIADSGARPSVTCTQAASTSAAPRMTRSRLRSSRNAAFAASRVRVVSATTTSRVRVPPLGASKTSRRAVAMAALPSGSGIRSTRGEPSAGSGFDGLITASHSERDVAVAPDDVSRICQ